ncbi:TolB family protein [Desulfonatronum lacustre]|uniref:TolB family protein n=1 Tax=Desulfonatronum lacustre TaxID=66849 RepID=UPI00048B0DBE|nr:hypothetical protein [Desulfonatronum lacustre]
MRILIGLLAVIMVGGLHAAGATRAFGAVEQQSQAGVEIAHGPDGLLELEQQGQVTVRALRAWGRLPDHFLQLGQRLRQDHGLDLLAANLEQIKAWIAQAEAGDAGLAPFKQELSDLAAFMQGGEYLDWQDVQDMATVAQGSVVRQDGRRWVRSESQGLNPAEPQVHESSTEIPDVMVEETPIRSTAAVGPESPEVDGLGDVSPDGADLVEGREKPVAGPGADPNWEWPMAAPESMNFELPERALAKQEIRMSDDMRHMAWLEGEEGQRRVLLNGNPGKWYDYIGGGYSLHFSSNGETFCFEAELGEMEIPVCNGVEGPIFEDIEAVTISEDGTRTLVAGRVSKGVYRLFLNGELIRETDAEIRRPILSADGTVAWSEKNRDNGSEKMMTSQGREDQPYQTIYDRKFTAESSDLLYIAVKEDSLRFLVRNGEELQPTMGSGYKFSATPDGAHYAYVSPCEEFLSCMVINGRVGPPYDNIWDPALLSEDGTRSAYVAKTEDSAALVLNESEFRHGFGNLKNIVGLTFSPDGRRWAAGLQLADDEYVLMVDGEEIARRAGQPRQLVFSPDGTKVAWLEKQGRFWRVLLDGVEGPGDREIFDQAPPQFSPDSRHLVYFHRDKERMHIAVFNGPERSHEMIPPYAVFSEHGAMYMAGEGHRFQRMILPLDE